MPVEFEGYGAWFLKRVRDTLLDDDTVMGYLNDEPRRIYHRESDNPPTGLSDEYPIVGLQLVSPSSDWLGAGAGVRSSVSVQFSVAASTRWYQTHPEEQLMNVADAISHRLSQGAGPNVIPLGVTSGAETQTGSDSDAGLAGHTHVARRARFRVLGVQ
ncbi:hypothetical protein C2R22_05915 [Salinigranum rubrum]|uniref:DUF3168 domain-containing protein n=1 Tax=Salinigranum rubrum TaxID=755307 RepID=A0A2I8VH88_9EURY|nr:hypothetical protein [Salinigranum rubrum]AUV81254.1 hypothetical protein C2R22_05915 [Salinigranum rubrum]